jgi:hypothetical protein
MNLWTWKGIMVARSYDRRRQMRSAKERIRSVVFFAAALICVSCRGDLGPDHPGPDPITAGPAVELAFERQPVNTFTKLFLPSVTVVARDALGNTATDFTGAVTLAIGANPAEGTLAGTTTVNAVRGVATFFGLSIELPGDGYTLTASSEALAGATSAPFNIAPPYPTLRFTTTTTGADVPSTYYICIGEDYFYYCTYDATIGPNSSATVSVAPGSYPVYLYVPGNCTVSENNPRTITAVDTTEVPFSISCVATGSVRVTSITTGTDIDPDGYELCVTRSGMNDCQWWGHADPNSTVTISGVTAEPHTVWILGLTQNCTVDGGTSRAVTVPVHGTVDLTFNVTCGLYERIAFSLIPDGITISRVDGLAVQTLGPGKAPAWSSDGAMLAYECDGDICTINANGTGSARLTADAAQDRHPTWSPDRMKIAFASTRSGAAELYVMNAEGTGIVRLTDGIGVLGSPAWSPDGARIAFDCRVQAGNDDICIVNADGTGFTRLTSDQGRDYGAAWKPDGSKMAFATTRFGGPEIALMNPDGTGITRIGSGLAGSQPTWSPDGTRLAFVNVVDDYWWFPYDAIFVADADGSNSRFLAAGEQPAWKPHP